MILSRSLDEVRVDTAFLEPYVRQLSSPDTDQRKQAIVALGKSKHPAALRLLAEVYRRERDDELRALAFRAGQYIQSQLSQTKQAPSQAAQPVSSAQFTVKPFIEEPAAELDVESVAPPSRQRRPTESANIKASKEYAENALNLHSQGQLDKAIKSLGKALSLNPTLAEDTYFLSIGSAILEVEESRVLDALKNPARRAEMVKAAADAKKVKAADEHLEEAKRMRWMSAGFDLAIYAFIVIVGPVLFILIMAQSVESGRAVVANSTDTTFQQAEEFTAAINVTSLVALAVTSAVCGLAGLLIQCAAIHFSATRFLGGRGTFRYLIYKLVSYYNRFLITALLVAYIALWIAIGQGIPVLLIPVGIGLGIFTLLKFIKLGDRIGEAYRFSAGSGFMSVVIASVVLVVVNGAIAYVMYLVLGNLLVAALPQV